MSACTLPNGGAVDRPTAFALLRDGKVASFTCSKSGQVSTVARAMGVQYTSRTVATGLIEVRLGKPRQVRPSGFDSPTAGAVEVLTLRERAELKRLLTKILSVL